MERFYVPHALQINSTVTIDGDEFHHLARVLRLEEDDEIELIDGNGALALGCIETVTKKHALVQILNVDQEVAPTTSRVLAVPLMRPSKLELVIEKGTEIGADHFFLYVADGSTQNSLSENQLARLHAITVAATKQSKRLYLPTITQVNTLKQLLESAQYPVFFGDVEATYQPWKGLAVSSLFITGPEKGFSAKELDLLRKKGQGVRMTPHVLRAETAPIVAISLLVQHQP
jgi:16S rRNA (uracil1498-N3)-methyltransferase